MSFLLQSNGDKILLSDGDDLLRSEPSIVLALSANIAASAATSTTAQLTAPAGKTTGNFEAGKISDDTNPLPSIDLGIDKYTELEWSIIATDNALTSDEYEFRVTKNGTVLESYGVTPSWTIGTAVTSYTLTADVGAFALSGKSASLSYNRAIISSHGVFTLAGIDASLEKTYVIVSNLGTFSLAGISANLNRHSTISSNRGIFSLTGNSANLIRGLSVDADTGALVLSGKDAAFSVYTIYSYNFRYQPT